MFNRLRLKLTLINISVVGLILLIVFSGIYILMQKGLAMQSEQVMRSTMFEARLPFQKLIPEQSKKRDNVFYVILDKTNNVLGVSPYMPVTSEALASLYSKAQEQMNGKGVIKQNSGTYRYLKVVIANTNNSSTIIVFLDMQPEKEILRRLLTTFITIGIVALALFFFGSLFLADRALVPVKEAWERQKNFVADASHELRTPLAVIQTNLELVMGNQDETVESQSKWLGNIMIENQRMAKLVSDLLLLARADSQQEQLEMRNFPLDIALREAVLPFEPIAEKKKIDLKMNINEELTYYGDITRIKQLIVILIDNAIKFTPAEGHVELTLKNGESHVEISVSDTGEGIDAAYHEKIFQRFYRVDKARARENGGTGLGLAIAAWIVKAHKGTITLHSNPGKGSRFDITLPKTN